jgi:hypothetical protein
MKSLFGDDRIHGNLVNEVEKVVNESLLLEQPWRLLDDLLNPLWKGGIKKKIGRLDNSRFEFDKSGNVLKNKKKIDKTILSNFLPDSVLSKLNRQLNEVSQTKESFLNYLTNKGDITIKSHFNEVLDGLTNQGILPRKTTDEIKDAINQSGLWGQLDNLFSPDQIDGFMRSINSDLDFKNTYPEVYEIFKSIPNLKSQIFKKLLPEGHKIFSNDFDAFLEFYSILEKSKIDDLDGKASKDVIEDYVIQYNQMKREIKMVNKRGGKLPPKIDAELREYGKKYKTLKPDVIGKDGNVTTPFTISNNGTITFNNVTLDGTEKVALENFINKGIKPTKAKGDKIKINLSDVDPDKSKLGSDGWEYAKNRLNINIYDRYIADGFRSFMKEFILKITKLSDVPAIERAINSILPRMSKLLDPEYLIKNKYYYSGGKGESRGIDDDWADMLNALWKPKDGIGGIFIENEKDALLYGKKVGEIKPRNVIKKVENQSQVLKTEFHKLWRNISVGIKPTYQGVDSLKAWRNRILKMSSATSFIGLFTAILQSVFGLELMGKEYYITQRLESFKTYVMKKNSNPNIIIDGVKIQYSNKCKESVKAQIQVIFGEDAKSKMSMLFDTNMNSDGNTIKLGKGILDNIFTVGKINPEKWPTEKKDGTVIIYNDTDNLPIIKSYEIKSNRWLKDGQVITDIGTVRWSESQKMWYLETVKEDSNGKKRTISLGCDDFKEFWLNSWKRFYKTIKDPSELEKQFREVVKSLPSDADVVDILNSTLENLTVDAMVENVEGALDTVKDAGEEIEKVIQDKVPGGGGNSGDAGSPIEW